MLATEARREPIRPAATPEVAKQRATLQARAALAGVELICLADASWMARRWGLIKHLTTDSEVADFVERLGGRQ